MKNLILIIVFSFLILFPVKAQDDKTNVALLLIDIQDFYFPGGAMELTNPVDAAENAALLLDFFRSNKMQIIHIRHEYEPGGAIHQLVKPMPDEVIFSKKEVNSFLNPQLIEYLNKNNIKNLVIAGMQTHMCVEAAVRAAHDLGFKITLIEDACATRNLKYKERTVDAADVHASTLVTLKSYATVTATAIFLSTQIN
jgi:nicotinamidase-related amidase